MRRHTADTQEDVMLTEMSLWSRRSLSGILATATQHLTPTVSSDDFMLPRIARKAGGSLHSGEPRPLEADYTYGSHKTAPYSDHYDIPDTDFHAVHRHLLVRT